MQLIPARGRKPADGHNSTIFCQIVIYPRKTLSGAARQLSRRESFSSCHLPCTKLPLSGELARRKPCLRGLSPQGDDNKSNTFGISWLATYPRKGTETHTSRRHRQHRANCNLSPQGDKKAPLPLAFASSGGALLFLIFYFTGWELRLPESSF